MFRLGKRGAELKKSGEDGWKEEGWERVCRRTDRGAMVLFLDSNGDEEIRVVGGRRK